MAVPQTLRMSAAKLMHAGLFENRMQSLLSVTRRFLEPTDFQLGLDKETKIYGACRPPAISLPAGIELPARVPQRECRRPVHRTGGRC